MRNWIHFSTALVLLPAVHAQSALPSKEAITVNAQVVFFRNADIGGAGLSVDYSRSFGRYLAIMPKLMMALGRIEHQGPLEGIRNSIQATALGAGAALRLTPFPDRCSRLKVDLGGIYSSVVSTTSYVVGSDSERVVTSVIAERQVREGFALIGGISFRVLDRKRVHAGLRMDALVSMNEGRTYNDLVQAGIYLGVSL